MSIGEILEKHPIAIAASAIVGIGLLLIMLRSGGGGGQIIQVGGQADNSAALASATQLQGMSLSAQSHLADVSAAQSVALAQTNAQLTATKYAADTSFNVAKLQAGLENSSIASENLSNKLDYYINAKQIAADELKIQTDYYLNARQMADATELQKTQLTYQYNLQQTANKTQQQLIAMMADFLKSTGQKKS